MLDFQFDLTFAAPNPADLEIEVYPTSPLTNQVAHIRLTGSAYDPKIYDVTYDYDDAGATYVTGGDANVGKGALAGHVWTTAGVKTVTATVRAFGVFVGTVTHFVTVTDIEATVWTHQVYVSSSGNFAGAPAASAAVTHVTTYAEWSALVANFNSSASLKVAFRDDETFTWDSTSNWQQNDIGLNYICRFGGGSNKPVIQANFAGFDGTMFRPVRSKVVVAGLRFEGGYDPVTGIRSGGRDTTFSLASEENDLSLYDLELEGVSQPISATGDLMVHNIGVINCSFTNWADYGVGRGSANRWTVIGCIGKQSPLANLGDGKPGGTPDLADHGFLRSSSPHYFCASDNDVAVNNGWSSAYGSQAFQPPFRVHPETGAEPYLIVINGNKTKGRHMATIGAVNAGDTTTLLGETYVENNRHDGLRQCWGFLSTDIGGVHIKNNVWYLPNLYDDGLDRPSFLFVENLGSHGLAVRSAPITARFNTIVSDRGALTASTGNEFLMLRTTWSDQDFTEENNIIHVPDHDGTFNTDYSPLSRGDNFAPVSGSAAIGAVTTGDPAPKDFDDTDRSLPTAAGAHQAAKANVAVAAPVNTSPPTIAPMTGWTDYYTMTDAGTWTNFDPYMIEYDWRLDGVSISDYFLTRYFDDGTAGSLSLVLTATNESGVRVSATSNAIVIS